MTDNRYPLIVGAGLAGLLAAHAWPTARIIEMSPFANPRHQALLRFRSDAVSKLTGIEFKKVLVRKGIFFRDEFVEPNARVCNLYAQKVIGQIAERSIWNLTPAERYIAPEDFYEQLIESVGQRIQWGVKFKPELQGDDPVISTIPMFLMLQHYGHPLKKCLPDDAFVRKSITVKRWRIPNSDVYQTIYFPDHDTPTYRASIIGDMLIAERVAEWGAEEEYRPLKVIGRAFGLKQTAQLIPLVDHEQAYGKLAELEEVTRKTLLFELTARHNIYSLGRFATWRNIMLDDVVNDIAMIKRLMKAQTAYDMKKEAL